MINTDSATTKWRRRATGTLASTAMIAAGFLAAGPASAAGTTIYVNAAGSSSPNCGTDFLQCSSIQDGVDKAKAGDTVQVAAGTYKESVTIKAGITVKGAGAASTTIDGSGLTLANGLVNIAEPGGDVTLTGFTIENQSAPGSDNNDSYAVTVNDTSASDTITVSNNVFPAVSPAREGENPYGINSLNTKAKQVITGNDFSGLWRGILLEGAGGPVDVSDNDFHDLISVPTGNDDDSTYPPKGVFFLADNNGNATEQNVTNNTFENYGGIGVAYRAGYNLGACSDPDRTCDGSITGTASGNTFKLLSPPKTNSTLGSQQPSAFNLQSLYEGDKLNLTAFGNTGTVAAPTRPFVEVPGAGTTTLTSTAASNNIVPTPAPTVTLALPAGVVAGDTPRAGSVSATNNSGEALDNVRYQVTIKGTKGIKASQVRLQYNSNPGSSTTFQDVTLTGTASSDSAITGSFGPAEGSTLADQTTMVTGLRLSIPDTTTPPDTLTTTVQLVQVSTGTNHPAINTLAMSNAATTDVTAPAPAGADAVKVTLGELAEPDRVQVVNATVTDANGKLLPTGTEVNFLVSGASVANGTVKTNSSGVARFLFRVQHAGSFTAKAVSGGKSDSVTAETPLRHVTTTLKVSTPSKGVITGVASTSPVRAGVKMAFVVDQGGKRVGIVTAITNANGVATQNITGLRSGAVYAITARIYGDADSDSVNSDRLLIRVK